MRRFARAITIAAVGVILVAGCSGQSAGHSATKPLHIASTATSTAGSTSAITFSGQFDGSGPAGGACRLFSQSEASKAIGEAAKPPEEGTDLSCLYSSQSQSLPGSVMMGLGSCQDIKFAARSAGAHPISGSAGLAMLTPSGTLYACKGLRALTVALGNPKLGFCKQASSGAPCPAVVTTEKNIAATMFSRLDLPGGACDKYTRDEATRAIGVRAAALPDLSLPAECKYSGTGNDTGAFVDVQLDTCGNISREAKAHGVAPTSGIGDKAFLEPGVGGTLYACKGNRGVGIQMNNPNARSPLATEISIFKSLSGG